MEWAAKPTGKRGRQPVYSAAAVQSCLTMKVLFGMAGPAADRATGTPLVQLTLARRARREPALPDRPGLGCAGFWRLQPPPEDPRREHPASGSQGPLHLLIDIEPASATGSREPARGIKVEGEGERHAGPAQSCPPASTRPVRCSATDGLKDHQRQKSGRRCPALGGQNCMLKHNRPCPARPARSWQRWTGFGSVGCAGATGKRSRTGWRRS